MKYRYSICFLRKCWWYVTKIHNYFWMHSHKLCPITGEQYSIKSVCFKCIKKFYGRTAKSGKLQTWRRKLGQNFLSNYISCVSSPLHYLHYHSQTKHLFCALYNIWRHIVIILNKRHIVTNFVVNTQLLM